MISENFTNIASLFQIEPTHQTEPNRLTFVIEFPRVWAYAAYDI